MLEFVYDVVWFSHVNDIKSYDGLQDPKTMNPKPIKIAYI